MELELATRSGAQFRAPSTPSGWGRRRMASRCVVRGIVLLVLLALAAGSALAQAQPRQPSSVRPERASTAIVFYLAKGAPDACGPGCSEWIAAEGPVDGQAALRLRALLSRLPNTRLPGFFHLTGGSA